jgi:hypothetical protein
LIMVCVPPLIFQSIDILPAAKLKSANLCRFPHTLE